MTTTQRTAFQNLLDAWNAHERNRNRGASIAELTKSRDRLDNARHRLATLA